MSKLKLAITPYLFLVLLTVFGVACEDDAVTPPSNNFEPAPAFVLAWGSQGAGDGQFGTGPTGVAVWEDTVFVADLGNYRIQKFDATGNFIMSWGSRGAGDGQFDWPYHVALDGGGAVYVTDGNRVQKFDRDGNFIAQWPMNVGNGVAGGIAIDGTGVVYVSDPNNSRIQKFAAADGNFLGDMGSNGNADGQFNHPRGLAVDASDNLYVVDNGNHRIQKFDSGGNFVTKWGKRGSRLGEFETIFTIAVAGNRVYVVDSGLSRIQVFDTSGKVQTWWGSQGSGDGQFEDAGGIAVAGDGSVYVTDWGNVRIQKFK